MIFILGLGGAVESNRFFGRAAKRELYFFMQPPSPRSEQQSLSLPLPRTQGHIVNQKLAEHLRVDRYGDFWLTDAIRPSLDCQVTPCQGFRLQTYRDRKAGFKVPVLAASVSRENIFDVFLDLLDPLGEVVDVVLETSHETEGANHQDLFREQIDLPVLKSYCCDFDHLLLNDGCTGIAALSTMGPMEVQFDEHKLLVVYAADMQPFIDILEEHGIPRNDKMKLITEGEHLHSTEPCHRREFDQLCYRLGVGEPVETHSW
jgi:hypothetical protein